MFLKVLICSLLCCTLTFADRKIFRSNWDEFPECSQVDQSPIGIYSYLSQYAEEKANVTFDLERTTINENVTFENDGETVFLSSDDFKESVTLENGDKFLMRVVNYHWGCAEHRLDDENFNGEVEVIFAKEGIKDSTAALKTPGGAVAISVFLKENETLTQDINELKFLSYMTPKLRAAGSSVEDMFSQRTLSLKNLLNMEGLYYRYTGRLTVTPCTERIERFVLEEPIQVTSGFLDDLRKCQNESCDRMGKSVQRPVQGLDARTVYQSKPDESD